MADLDDVCAAFAHRHRRRLRIATKYVQLTRGFFAHAGISDYRIVESAGATEGAPAAGTAEAIVDITTTGATLAANALKIVDDGTILESQAQLAASISADWTETSLRAAEGLLARLGARETAKASQVLRVRLDNNAEQIIKSLEMTVGVSILSRPAQGNASGEYSLLCARKSLMSAMASLRKAGCDAAVTAQDIDYVFDKANPLFSDLKSTLKK
jgi:ATP phosphoribosyltransferase